MLKIMGNSFFRFRQFTVNQEKAAFKVGTDGVLLGAAADLNGVSSLLDIGTGTGLIALMCAQRSEAAITAIEPDHDSFVQATENVAASKWPGRITVVENDLATFTSGTGMSFDLLISNPPWFRNSLLNADLKKAASRHNISLTSDELIKCAARLLKPSGSFQLILPYEEGTLFIAEAAMEGFFCNSVIKVKPTPEGKVKRLILKLERTKKPTREKFLTIETGSRHSYTEEYRELTGEFYL